MAQIKAKQIKLVAQGDMIIGDSSSNGSILSIGAANQVILSNGTTGAWGYLGQLRDPSGTVVVDTDTTPSQVNNIEITGGATGTGPTFTAQGTDTNIDINLITKGSGEVLVPIGYTVTSANALITKQYADSIATGLDFKNSVRAATVSSSELSGYTYTASNDDETVGAAPWSSVTNPVFDGITLVDGDRVLIKNASDQRGNGIFVYDSGASTFVRAEDADNSPSSEVSGGMFTFVEEGLTQADTGWVASDPDGAATLGTTSIVMTQFSAAGVISPGNGLSQSGNDFDVNVDDITTTIDGANDVVVGHDDGNDYSNQVLFGQDSSGGQATAQWDYVEDLRASSTGELIIDGVGTGSAVNYLRVTNAAAGGDVTVETVGDDTNIDLVLTAKGTGRLDLDGTLWPTGGVAQRSVLVTQDGSANDLSAVSAPDGSGNQILVYNDSTNTIEWQTQASIGGNCFSTINGDTGSATADSTSDTLTITGGVAIVTAATDDPEVITIDLDISELATSTDIDSANDTVVVYDDSTSTHVQVTIDELLEDANLPTLVFSTVAGDTGTATADNSSDTLTIAGGEAITTTATDDPEVLTVDLDIDSLALSTDIDTAADVLVLYDDDAGVHVKVTIDELLNDANIPVVAFTTVAGDSGTATADGETDTLTLTGGVAITTTATDDPEVVTFDLAIDSLASSTDIDSASDTVVVYDDSTGTHVQVTIDDLIDDADVAQLAFSTVTGDSGTANADSSADSLNLAGGVGITTTAADTPDSVTFDLAINTLATSTDVDSANDTIVLYDSSAGSHVQVTIDELLEDSDLPQVAFTTVAGDSGSAVADSATDTITFVGGSAITTVGSDVGDTLTIDLDIDSLAASTDIDSATDTLVIYDDSAGINVKVTIDELLEDSDLPQVAFTTITGDSGSADADTATDSLNIAGGSAITTTVTDDPEVVTIDLDVTSLAVSTDIDPANDTIIMYDDSTSTNVQVNIDELLDDSIIAFTTVAGDSGSATADIRTDTLTIAGGTGITTTATDDPEVVTIDLDINELTLVTPGVATDDELAIHDTSAGGVRKTTVGDLVSDLGVGTVAYDDAVATGGANEAFASFFASAPTSDAAVTVFFNGLALRDTGWTRSGTTLTMVDAVNGYSTESGDIISARYETAP